MKNIYDGNITTDGEGLATVNLPDRFEALNRDFRYQLTVIGVFAQAIVAHKIEHNQFQIGMPHFSPRLREVGSTDPSADRPKPAR